MSETPLTLIALVLWVVLLLALVQWVFLRLRRTDAALFDELGRPDLFLNNNVPNVIAFWRWVYGRSLHYIGGVGLSGVLWAIRVGTIAYGIALVAFVIFQMRLGA